MVCEEHNEAVASIDINWLNGHTCFYCNGAFLKGQHVTFKRVEDMDGEPTGISYHTDCSPFRKPNPLIR